MPEGDGRWLVLCGTDDLSALWAHVGLQRRGIVPIDLVTTEVLAFALRCEHRIDAAGSCARFELPDGRVVDTAALRGVLNRMVIPSTRHWQFADAGDREYAESELFAFHLGWLVGLRVPVLNPATPYGLCGEWRWPSYWHRLAAWAGFRTAPYQATGFVPPPPVAPKCTVVVVGPHVCGPALPPDVADACRRLVATAGLVVAGVDLVPHDDGLVFAGATPLPDLTLGGGSVLDALADVLANGVPP